MPTPPGHRGGPARSHPRGSIAPGFNLRKLSPMVWAKADGISGLADAATVATWSDVSGNGRNFVQATEASKPLYKVNIQNGLPIVRFDGTDDVMQTAAFTSTAQPFTVFAAAKWPAWAATVTMFDGIVGNDLRFFRDAATNVALFAGAQLSATVVQATAELFQVWSFVYNGASSDIYMSGTKMSTTGNAGTAAVTGVTLAAFGSGAAGFSAIDFGEFALFKGVLSAANHNLIGNSLGSKWGKTWTTVT